MTPDNQLKKGVFYQVLLFMFIITACNAVVVQPNSSREAEYVLRQELKKYDPMVRPVQSPKDKLNVSFSAKLVSLIGLDIKKQMATTKLLIVQKWDNQFLVWNQSTFYGLDQVRMSFNEVWVPDIKLQNSPDNPLIQRENLPLFKSWVTVYSNGTNVWVSMEMINSECDIDIANFPFDSQTCYLTFSSESYDSTFLGIKKSGKAVQKVHDLKNVSSGEWNIDKDVAISIEEKPRDDMPGRFDEVVITLKISRRRIFYVLYFLLPCVVLALLMFISFLIPPESGERIGFCSSLLLALSVYLLLFTELLPNSRHVSLLGALFVVVFLETALALLATVIVLKAFYSSNEIPRVLGFFCGFGCKHSKKQKKSKIKPLSSLQFWKKEPISMKNDEPDAMRLENFRTSLDSHEPTNASPMTLDNQENQNEENQRRWSRVARRLDSLFFWIFMLGMLASIGYMIYNADGVQHLSI